MVKSKKKLSVWAKENGVTYTTAWLMVKKGRFDGKCEISDTGRIYIVEEEKEKEPSLSTLYESLCNAERIARALYNGGLLDKDFYDSMRKCRSDAGQMFLDGYFSEASSGLSSES